MTGGSSGIGRATVALLGARGATVGVLDRTAPADSDTAWAQCDIADAASVEQSVAELAAHTGRADVLVCSAGINASHSAIEHPVDLWDQVLGVNLTGTFHTIRACLPSMLERRWGRIVTLSSGGAVRVLANRAAYAASKAGVIALTKAVAMEAADRGVTANVIAPGLTDTPMAAQVYGDRSGAESAVGTSRVANPMGVLLSPDDIAGGIDYLCSPAARYVTGQVLHINAGGVM
ncbi:SDR family NAD(P)-dependent oxidoreductase [Diaminobutyricimonas sp. TR449]|uniref:SDR family NAD(P)-dependent oxidoreductase n=1 Tax=Diaminobutyricimonas sp. TR449 TaxID=2708076 RepID=UPI00141D931E|nr:SDR family NAD(P)-dependent oxidoreductase [Diaminobutyricimonas sp. TR449]